jgi:hypothetical protein
LSRAFRTVKQALLPSTPFKAGAGFPWRYWATPTASKRFAAKPCELSIRRWEAAWSRENAIDQCKLFNVKENAVGIVISFAEAIDNLPINRWHRQCASVLMRSGMWLEEVEEIWPALEKMRRNGLTPEAAAEQVRPTIPVVMDEELPSEPW